MVGWLVLLGKKRQSIVRESERNDRQIQHIIIYKHINVYPHK